MILIHLVLLNLVEMVKIVHLFLIKATKCQAIQAAQQEMSDGLIQIPCQKVCPAKYEWIDDTYSSLFITIDYYGHPIIQLGSMLVTRRLSQISRCRSLCKSMHLGTDYTICSHIPKIDTQALSCFVGNMVCIHESFQPGVVDPCLRFDNAGNHRPSRSNSTISMTIVHCKIKIAVCKLFDYYSCVTTRIQKMWYL